MTLSKSQRYTKYDSDYICRLSLLKLLNCFTYYLAARGLGTHGFEAVSYTHLTLPTILLV